MSAPVHQQDFVLVTTPASVPLEEFAGAVKHGLKQAPKALPCRFLYDARGSAIFEDICDLPEYYLTRIEEQILRDHAPAMAALLPAGASLVELGSGSARKTRQLIAALLERREQLEFIPIDISSSILTSSSQDLLLDFPGLRIQAIAAEYLDGLRTLDDSGSRPRCLVFLGSNLGNFDRASAEEFLTALAQEMHSGDTLILGTDLRKDRATLERAYDDAAGVTASFTKNILVRINRELGGHFNVEQFGHRARYHVDQGRVEIELESLCQQRVLIDELSLEIDFADGERIHVEDSYKYSPAEIDDLAERCGMRTVKRWCDAGQRFAVQLLERSEAP